MSERVNIKFQDLSYTVERGVFKKTQKRVLKSISGEFKACELTAVMGTSGCGKSSLLNILSGYVTENVTGVLEINEGQLKRSYIMQEENLHSLITVSEAMMFSIHFKTGSRSKTDEKKSKVKTILTDLGLEGRMDTFMKDLSGGQQKRLSIALELVDDPSILFLDEPTTGLDSSSSTQCIQLLKKLAQRGKTIICTIHTPSARLFEMFDHLYAMSHGHCIYQGSSKNLIPFLSQLDLKCPPSYNPSDFLMEIANGDYGSQNHRLTKKIQNGADEGYREDCNNNVIEEFIPAPLEKSIKTLSKSFINQLHNLMIRNAMIIYRDKSVMWLRFVVHIVVAVLVGLVFLDTGRDASKILSTFRLIYSITMFQMYTGFYSLVSKFSLEMSIIKREHFNKWYSTSAYYLALSLSDIPLLVVCTCSFVSILYFMSNQPAEEFRFFTFLAIQLLMSFVAQGFGMMTGSVFKLKGSLFFAAIALPIIVLFCGVVILQKDANIFFNWVFALSFVKHAGDSSMSTIFGYNRTKMECAVDFYCHFERPQKFLDMLGVGPQIDFMSIFFLILYFLIFRAVAFCMISYRLKH